MGMIQEFKEFAMKGNVMDMAVGIIMGGAFGKIVTSLVEDVLMPPIGYVMNGIDFSSLAVKLGGDKPVNISYGKCITTIIQFIAVAFCVFMLIKAMNKMKKPAAAAAAAPPPDVVLLGEIRDLLKKH